MNISKPASSLWPKSVVIIESPAANLSSIYNALKRIQNIATEESSSFSLQISRNPKEILHAERIIFPGVGHANYIMAELQRSDLKSVLQQVDVPIMGICLGMQLLFEQLSEGEKQDGLSLLPGSILPLREALDIQNTNQHNQKKFSVPHMGWNQIQSHQDSNYRILQPDMSEGAAYFVHSYYYRPPR